MSTSLSDISSGLSIYVSPSILVSQIYCACCFCCTLMTQIFMAPARYKGRDFRDKKFCKPCGAAVFEFDSIYYQFRALVSLERVSLRAGASTKGGAPLAQNCLREGRPMPMMRFYLLFLHDAFFALGVFFQTALTPLPYFLSSLSSTSALSTK